MLLQRQTSLSRKGGIHCQFYEQDQQYFQNCLSSFQNDEFLIVGGAEGIKGLRMRDLMWGTILTTDSAIWHMDINKQGCLAAIHGRNRLLYGVLDENCIFEEVFNHPLTGLTGSVKGLESLEFHSLIFHTSDHIYQMNTNENLTRSILFSAGEDDVIRTFSSSPLEQKLMAFATEKEGLLLSDLRINRKTPSSNHLPSSNISKLEWNPFISYWIATSSDDSVDFWDLRYMTGKPIVKFYCNFVNTISWSNSNAELLLAAASTRNFHLFNIADISKSNMSISHPPLGGDVTQILRSQKSPNQFNCLTNLGKVTNVSLGRELLQTMVPLSMRNSEIDINIYCREADAVYRGLKDCSDPDDVQLKRIDKLVSLNSKDEGKVSFNDFFTLSEGDPRVHGELQELVTKFPPNFEKSLFKMAYGSLEEAVSSIKFKIKLDDSIKKGEVNTLVRALDTIFLKLQETRTFISHPRLLEIVKLTWISKKDRISVIKFVRELILRVYEKWDHNSAEMLLIVFDPTIYGVANSSEIECKTDTGSTANSVMDSTQTIQLLLRNLDMNSAMELLDLQSEYLSESKQKRSDILLKAISQDNNILISLNHNELILNELSSKSQLDAFLRYALQLLSVESSSGFQSWVHSQVEGILPKVKFVIDQALDIQRSPLVLRAILLLILLIRIHSHQSADLSTEVIKYLLSKCKQFSLIVTGENYVNQKGLSLLNDQAKHVKSLKLPTPLREELQRLFSLLKI